MQITQRIGLLGVTMLGLFVPTLILSGCGGGGSSVPSALTGTYSGRYSLPSANTGGNLVLRVQGNGHATGVFDENTSDELSASGTMNSNGRITLQARITRNSQTATIDVTGQAESNFVTGQIVLNLPQERDTGTFSTSKTSNDSTASALHSDEPTSTTTLQPLGKKLGVESTGGASPQ